MAYTPKQAAPRKSWASSIAVTNDIDAIKLKLLLKGGPGVGKTKLLGTAPNLFVVDAEGGLLTLVDKAVKFYPLGKLAKGAYYDTTMAILDSIEANECVTDDEGNVIVDFSQIETIGLDSVSKLSELFKQDIDEKAGNTSNTQALWGDLRSQMIMVMNRFYQLDKHLIVTVGEAQKVDESDRTYYDLNMQGSYKNTLPHEFDFVLTLVKEATRTGTVYYTTSETMGGRTGKTRGIELSKKIEEPTFQLIWDEITKKLKGFNEAK